MPRPIPPPSNGDCSGTPGGAPPVPSGDCGGGAGACAAAAGQAPLASTRSFAVIGRCLKVPVFCSTENPPLLPKKSTGLENQPAPGPTSTSAQPPTAMAAAIAIHVSIREGRSCKSDPLPPPAAQRGRVTVILRHDHGTVQYAAPMLPSRSPGRPPRLNQ